MGSGSFDAKAYRTFSDSTVGKSTDQIYTSRGMNQNLNPLGVQYRESRDSDDNPNSTPIIVALDVTGSMGMIADVIAREGLGTLFTGILDRKPVSDPHVMFMGIGDAHCDQAPLQVSQFEADNRIVEQLAQLYLEGNGGGNRSESYHLAWFFAGFHTVHDSIEKRGKRGYLFTVGDEETPPPLTRKQIERVTGDIIEADLSADELLQIAQRKYNVFHVIIEEGYHARSHPTEVLNSWRALLGQHVISLSDYKALAETIVSAIQVAEGSDADSSSKGWGKASTTVHNAIKHIPQGKNRPALGGPK